MATRAEQAHADAQRTSKAGRRAAAKSKSKSGPAAAPRRGRSASKATVARESPGPDGRTSRKSTRKSANHMKSTSTVEIREGIQKGSPEAKARRARARTSRVRGSGGA